MDWYDWNWRRPHLRWQNEPDIETADEFDEFGSLPYARGQGPRSGPQLRYTPDWEVPGPYTGMGPSADIGQDDWIYHQVNERLMAHGKLDASDIEVSVNEGVVTLTGSVDSRKAKRMAEDTVDSVLGVVDVSNELRIEPKEQNRQEQGQMGQGRQGRSRQEQHGQRRRSLVGQRAPWDRY